MSVSPLNIQPENSVSVIRGSSKTFELSVTDSKGVAVDLTGAKVVLTVKAKAEDRDPLIFKTSDDPLQAIITLPREGKAQIYLIPGDTQKLEVRPYVFDIWVLIVSSGKRFAVVPPSVFDVQAAVTALAP